VAGKLLQASAEWCCALLLVLQSAAQRWSGRLRVCCLTWERESERCCCLLLMLPALLCCVAADGVLLYEVER
jgi:hypothetical protein